MATDNQAMSIGEVLVNLGVINDDEKLVSETGDSFIIHDVCSWRGVYMLAAVVVGKCHPEHENAATAADLREAMIRLLEETFEGWKGGEYTYSYGTEVFLVGDHGSCGLEGHEEYVSFQFVAKGEREHYVNFVPATW